jgi:hypothetical protein
VQRGVAQQPLDRRAVQAGAVDGDGTGTSEGQVVLDVQHHVDVGAVAAAPAGVLVVEEEPADVPERVGAGGGAAPGLALGVWGLCLAQCAGEEFAGFRAQVAVEPPAVGQGARQVQALGWLGAGGTVGGGTVPPGPHGRRDIGDRQGGHGGHHFGLAVGEQTHGVGVEVGGDGLDLTGRQHPVSPRGGGDRQPGKLAGPSGGGGGAGAGHAGLIGQPRGHGGGPVELPQGRGVDGGDGVGDAGIEPVAQRQRGGEGAAVDGDVQPLDCVPQLPEHAPHRTRVRIMNQAKTPAQTTFLGLKNPSRAAAERESRAARRAGAAHP